MAELELPGAAVLGEIVLSTGEGQAWTDEVRRQAAVRAEGVDLGGLTAHFASLTADPLHSRSCYIAVDGPGGEACLLHFAPDDAPPEALFPGTASLGHVRVADREFAIHLIPFSSRDWDAIRTFAERVEPAFLPRPQRALPAIATGNRHPEISLPAAFTAFRAILDDTGVNMASTAQLSATREMTTDDAIAARDGETPTAAGHTRVSIRHLYHAGVWAAIRAGWREGFTAEADHFIVSGDSPAAIAQSVEAAKDAIRHAAGFTKFTTDTSRLFVLEADTRHPQPWTDAVVAEKFKEIFPASEQAWILGEFARPFAAGERVYQLTAPQIRRLAVKFGESLKLNEELYDTIVQVRGHAFDFEPSIDEAETLTTPEEMIFCMHWLALRGRPAQLVPPNLGFKKRQAYPETLDALDAYVAHKMWPELTDRVSRQFGGRPLDELFARVADLAAVARHFDGTLSIHSGSGKQAAVLECIGHATAGRVNYKISGELQLQLLDVLAEQEPGSRWRGLFQRMADRANAFAASGAFGAESELAALYKESYLGDAPKGRADGNLFLVFWIGNIVGSRDTASPDGDQRFFKEKLDELPGDLLAEVRQRNARYIRWLAAHLRA